MENTTKTDNFLQAIQRYTEEQKSIANTEVELLKEEKLKKAEENGKRDSERYILFSFKLLPDLFRKVRKNSLEKEQK